MKSSRFSHPRLLVCLLALSASAAACAHGEEAITASKTSALSTCSREAPIVNLGDLPMGFVPNEGQSPEEVLFSAINFGAGTLSVGAEGVLLDLADHPGKKLPAASILTRHHGASLALHPSSACAAKTNVVTAERTTNVEGCYAELAQEDLYPGVGVAVGGTMRMLVTTYTVAPGASPSQVRFSYDGASHVSVDPTVGSLSVVVGDGARTLSLGPVEAYQIIHGESVPVEARYVIEDDIIGLSAESYDPSEPLMIRTRLLHSPFFRAGGTAAADGKVYAVGRGYNTTNQETGGDVYVAVLDEATGALVSTTVVAGEGDDEGNAIAITSHGEIVIAGQTRSLALPTHDAIQPDNAGGSDGFVVQLDAEGASLIKGTYLGNVGDDAATGVAVAANGDVLVASTATKAWKASNVAQASFLSTLPVQGAFTDEVPYAITALGASLDDVRWVAPITGKRIRRPRLWLDCHGLIRFGVRSPQSLDCTTLPDKTYEMAERTQSYDQDQPDPNRPQIFGWGFHALRWKYHLVNDMALPGYTPTNLSWAPWGTSWFGNMPRDYVPNASGGVDDVWTLNDAEANGLFTHAQTSLSVDPRGTWERGDHDTPETLAVKTALLEHLWRTPVYMTKVSYDLSGHASAHAMVVEQTTFDMCFDTTLPQPAPGLGLEDLCNLPPPGDWFGNVSCNNSGVHNLSFLITEFGVSAWSEPHPVQPYYHEHFSLQPYPPGAPTWWWYEPGRFVFDPPAEEAQADAKITEAADRIAPSVTARAMVIERTITGGTVTRTVEKNIVARASDLR